MIIKSYMRKIRSAIHQAVDESQMNTLSSEFDKEDVGIVRRKTPVVLFLLLLAFLLWAWFMPIAEITKAQGQIIPQESVVQIQHPESGELSTVNVEEGQLVKEGDILMTLDPTAIQSEYEQLQARYASLEIESIRINAFLSSTMPDFSAYLPEYQALVTEQNNVLQSQGTKEQATLDALRSRLKQRTKEHNNYYAELRTMKSQLRLVDDKLEMLRELEITGDISKLQVIQTNQERATMLTNVERLRGRLNESAEQIKEAKFLLAESESNTKNANQSRSSAIESEKNEIKQSLTRVEYRMDNLTIRSPIAGFVKGLTIDAKGEVATAGNTLLEIIPMEGNLIAEARIDTKDVAYVQVGQTVNVQVTAYDFSKHGTVTGTLEHVSSNTFLDEKGNPYFKTLISLEQQWVGQLDNYLMPGMVLQADILTGEKTVADYLLEPFKVAQRQAFSER